MLTFDHRIDNCGNKVNADFSVTLPFESRQKSRLRIALDNGDVVGIILPRGSVIKDGDCLADQNNHVLEIRSAKESVSVVNCESMLVFARLCYHLGNRHVPLQIVNTAENAQSGLWACYLADHVLDQMVVSLGGVIRHEQKAFEPESGAYHHHHD